MIELLRQKITTAPWLHRCSVNAIDDVYRMYKLFFQVRDMFKKQGLVPQGNMVEEHQVLVKLTHITHMRYNGYAIFF